jgi:type II secretory pathway pseudopilin PulG
MRASRGKSGEKGYVLLALMLALTLLLIAMAIEAPRIAQQIKREREEELVHRGKDYAMAVKRFVHKSGGRYPTSIDQLENTNRIRFLRKRYKDPMTGEANWKMVHAGEAEIKMPTPNPGLNPSGNPGLNPSGNPGLSGSGIPGLNGSGTPRGPGGGPPVPNTTAPVLGGGQLGQVNPQPGGTGQLGSLTTTNIGNGQAIGGGQIIGVASVSKGKSIKEFNDQDEYDGWYFVYDLRLEQAGGSGVTIASPRVGGNSAVPAPGQQQQPGATPVPSGTPAPGSTPAPTPPPVPN